jgi:aromatase
MTTIEDPPARVTHHVTVSAPADAVYALVADTSAWPWTFGPTVHVQVLEPAPGGTGAERLRLWALANGTVRTWTSRRELDPVERTVRFAQEVPAAPVVSMSGEWRVTDLGTGATLVELLHSWTAADDAADRLIARAVDSNSTAELEALRIAAEQGPDRAGLVLDFTDTVDVPGGDPAAVRAFLRDADRWPQRLPHVARLDLVEDEPGVQVVEMDTRAGDGPVHTTRSVRVCLDDAIVYKQTATPQVMAAHVGRWTVEAVPGGARVSSRHVVVLDPGGVAAALGPDGTTARARELVRAALGTNSTTTMRHAAAFATGRD